MKKKLFCVIAAITVIFQSTLTFAADPKLIFNDVKYYNARIYVCDTQNKQAILVNVVPLHGSYNINYTRDLEYNAISLCSGNIFNSNGEKLSMEQVNGYFLDSRVKVLIGKNGYGNRILSMEFLK